MFFSSLPPSDTPPPLARDNHCFKMPADHNLRKPPRQNHPSRQDNLPPRLDRATGSSQPRHASSMSNSASVKQEKKVKLEAKRPGSYDLLLKLGPVSSDLLVPVVTQFDNFKMYLRSDNVPYSAANAIDAGREMARTIDAYVKDGTLPLGSEKRVLSWQQTVESTNATTLPSIRIGLCGVTGAGKSSLLNALLGDNLIPTSSFRACTATVTEVSYHPLPEIHACVLFVTEDEWRGEIQALMDEVSPAEGEEPPHAPPPGHPTWAKIEEVYPSLTFAHFLKMSADDVLAFGVEARKFLGTEKQIRASDTQTFSEEIQQYVSGTVSSAPSRKTGALWPLIVKTHILCNADILSTGAILVDLPGSGDTNVARGSVARNYVGSCDKVWIVAPIVRAVTSESGKAFLGEAFSLQLKMGKKELSYDQAGRSGVISFICTKCDDVSSLEIARELRIHEDVQYQELLSLLTAQQDTLKGLKTKINAANMDISRKTIAVKALAEELRILQTGGNDENSRPQSAPGGSVPSKRTCLPVDPRALKRRRNDVDGMVEVSHTQVSVNPPCILELKRQQLEEAQKSLDQAKGELSGAKLERTDGEDVLKEAKRRLNAFCSLKRSEVSAAGLRERFLQDLFAARGVAKEEVPFLPVFCCSAMEYRRHNFDIYESDDPICTVNREETGIPAIIGWCKHLGRTKQIEAAQKHTRDMKESVGMIQGLFDAEDDKKVKEKINSPAILKTLWASDDHGLVQLEDSPPNGDEQAIGIRGRLRLAISTAISKGVQDLKAMIAESIGQACRVGADLAAKEAMSIAVEFGRANKWQTYCATFRRRGEYKADLNLDFARPFYAEVYPAWVDFFESNRFEDVGELIHDAVQGVLDEVLASAPPALIPQVRRRTCRAADWCQDRLERTVATAGNQLNVEQKRISRTIVQFIKSRLLGVYSEVLQESKGKGQFMRMKEVFNAFILNHGPQIYQDTAKHIEDSLFKAVDKSIGEMVEPFSRFIEKVDADMAGLWEKVEEDRTQLVRKREAKDFVTLAAQQLDMWDRACEQFKVEAATGVTLEDMSDKLLNIDGILQKEHFSSEDTVRVAKSMARTLDQCLSNGPISLLGTTDRQEIWRKAVRKMSHMKRPTTRIGLCGVSGSGKSSVINALLGFRHRLVPTSGFGAGTATVTEVSYHNLPEIHGSVSFTSDDDWKNEIHALLEDTMPGVGEELPTHPPANNLTWSKIRDVYPKLAFKDFVTMTPEEVLDYDPAIRKLLGTTVEIKASDVETFSRQIDQYATGNAPSETLAKQALQPSGSSSSNQPCPKVSATQSMTPFRMPIILKTGKLALTGPRHMATTSTRPAPPSRTSIWPLIITNRIKCNAEVLSTGAILVDLPGSGDVNQVRNTAAEMYIAKCDAIWIVAPIERVKDSSVAREFLGKAMQRQLLSEKSYFCHLFLRLNVSFSNQSLSIVSLIATKCDSVVPEEIIRNLQLEDDPVYLELDGAYRQAVSAKLDQQTYLDALRSDNEELGDIQMSYEQRLEELKLELNGIQAPEGPKRPASPHGLQGMARSPKRQRDSKGAYVDLPAPVPSSSDGNREPIQSIQAEIADVEQMLKDVVEQRSPFEKHIQDARLQLSESTEKITNAGLEIHKFCSLKRSEIACSLLRTSFLPSLNELPQDSRSAPRASKPLPPLPIFCVSPREYDRLTKKDTQLEPPTCSRTVDDTGIPALRAWCMHVARTAQIEHARRHLTKFKQSVASMQRFFEGSKTSPTNDFGVLKARWASDSLSSNKPLSATQTVRQTQLGIRVRLEKEFSSLISEGVQAFKDEMSTIIGGSCRTGAKKAAAAASKKAVDFGTETKWQTYAATLRRHGCWKKRNLNEEFTAPMSEEIAFPWATFFHKPAFVDIKTTCDAAARTLLDEIIDSSPPALAREVKRRVDRCADLWVQRESQAVKKSAKMLDVGQKEVSRILEGHVECRLAPAYDNALEETGRGSHARKQEVFNNFIKAQSGDIYHDVAERMVERLLSDVDSIESYLKGALNDAAKEMEVDIAGLWDSVTDDKSELLARQEGAELISKTADQLDQWGAVLNKHKLASTVPDTFPVISANDE
ncbi:hypothetical protein OF83DRAFT_1173899 [Amylostereum chailletii]|nr:hypothetical protein OF83DRAFT_1173899 [Amylostereum chailletii]